MFENLYQNALKDLPVNAISDDVMNSVDNNVSIISSPTGSGKTLTIPAKLADRIPENERVVVLVPRKFLAINAAETVAELSGKTLGNEVGYAVGTQGGDEPLFGKNSKIIFATYGYAISSGMIFYEKNIILDEVHEASMDMSIAKALINYRKSQNDNLRVIEMSATINLDKQKAYWEQYNPKTFESEGKTFGCQIIEDNNKDNAEHVIDLLTKKNRKGIAVFESGVADIEETKEKIEALLLMNDIKDVEVSSIYGEMDKKDRDKALKAPAKGNRKVIIGTNVIESGMNIPWLDAGVTSGKGKDLFVTSSGAIALKEQDLPQWRLQQQKGRVCRFTDGIFVLASNHKWEERNKETTAEISRLPLTSLIMDCASFDLKAEELNFDAPIDHEQLLEAKKKLKRLNLIDENDKLTKLGKFANDLPVTIENAVVLKYAQSREYCLPQAIVMVAISEQGNLRQNFKSTHNQDETSDIFDGIKAFIAVDKELKGLKKSSVSKKEAEGMADKIFYKYNVSKKRFYETKELIRDLRSRLGVRFSTAELQFDYNKLKQCLIAGNIEKLNIDSRNIFTSTSFDISNTSAVFRPNMFLAESRQITPKNGGRSFIIYEKVTSLSTEDIKTFLRKNPSMISQVDKDKDFHILDSTYIYNGELKSFVEESFQSQVEQALNIATNKSLEEYNEFVQKNKIPEIYLQEAINDKVNDAITLKTLSQPVPQELAVIQQKFEKQRYNSSTTIDENTLQKFGLIQDNKAELQITPQEHTHFRINNPNLSVNIFINNENSYRINFYENRVKELKISSNKENKAIDINMRFVHADKISISDINVLEFDGDYMSVNNFEYNNVNAEEKVDLSSSTIERLDINNSKIDKLDLEYTKITDTLHVENTKIKDISTNYRTTLKQKSLYASIEDGQVEFSNQDPQEEQATYEKVLNVISTSNDIENLNIETLLADYDLSKKYQNMVSKAIADKIKENKIIARKEALRKMGLKVAQNIPENTLENTGYKDIATDLSKLNEFKDFAKGDITEDEFTQYIIHPVEERKENLYQKTLEEKADIIKSVITTNEKIDILKQRLSELHGLNIREEDIQNLQDIKNKEEQEIKLQEKLSHTEEIAADKLIEFFVNDEDYGFNYFDEAGYEQQNKGYTQIALGVMKKLEIPTPQGDIYEAPQETQNIFYQVRDRVMDLVAKMDQHCQFNERQQQWEDNRYDFLADIAGYENAENKEEKQKETNEKELLKAAKKQANKNKKEEKTFNGLDSLAALKNMFSQEK